MGCGSSAEPGITKTLAAALALAEDSLVGTAPSALSVLRQIHSGEKSCAAFVTEALDRIDTVNGRLNACVEVAQRAAILARAATVDEKVKAGEALRPLEGLPMIVKLNIDTVGMLTSGSTAALKDNRPETNAVVWQRLEDAGALCIAKTNMPELAAGNSGYNPLHGHAWNPHGAGYSTGGSSSGTAAAIAAGVVACGLGSDTAGSLRVPAEINGVCGLRPSLGRYPVAGCVPLSRQDTPGPMASSVADIALLDAIMAGEASSAPPVPLELSGIKVIVPAKWVGEVTGGTRAALDLAVAALRAAGATVEELPADDEAFAALDAAIEGVELCKFGLGPSTSRRDMDAYLASHAGLAGRVTTDTIAETFHWSNTLIPAMLTSEGGKALAALGAEEFSEALKPYAAEQAKIEAAYDAYLSDAGASFLLTPCTSGPPTYLAGEGEGSFVKLEAAALAAKEAGDMKARFMASLALYMPKISPISAKALDFAIPSIAIPTAARHECGGASLPAGVLAWGPVRSDRRLIEFGLALEARLANK